MNWQKCGAQVDDQAVFCDKCGTALRETGVETGTSAPTSSAEVQYAGFWRRLGAFFIDQFAMQLPYLFFVVMVLVVGVFMDDSWVETAIIYTIFIGYLVAYLLYGPLMESSPRQATLGKQALGIVVTDMGGKRISFARAVGRNLGKIVSYMIYGVGFIMIALTAKKQGLHDIMAKCVVVKM